MNGKTIDLTSDDININSNGLSISSDGNSIFKGAGSSNTSLQVEDRENENHKTRIFPQAVTIAGNSGVTRLLAMGGCRLDMTPTVSTSGLSATAFNDGELEHTEIRLFNSLNETRINPSGITTPTLTQTSKAENKKNFEKLENGLNIVKSTDIYKYNLINQNDGEKKHIGFVIGKNFNYSSEITAIDDEGDEIGVDNYSMTSVLWKAVQEQQETIENMQKQINELKGE